MNDNTIIKNTKLPLLPSLSNIGGDHNTIFDDSTEFSWIYWLFDTVDNSENNSTFNLVEACSLKNVYKINNSFDQLNTYKNIQRPDIRDLSFCGDFLEVDEDMKPLRLDILENDFN
ncbi:26221_t:CDS:1, partial [Dentiscutata erythropus]